MAAVWVILGILVFLVLVYIAIYNGLIGKKNMVENAFSSIDVMLKKRFDLIPNLVANCQKNIPSTKTRR